MTRFLPIPLLVCGLALAPAARAQSLPARPQPFTFVTDQAKLLAPADAKKLDDGLRRYADANGTQVVVVTVPSLGGRPVADYARALGTEWGVGQRGKNNGVVVLLSGQERQVSIQAGSGLQSAITPAVTGRIINQQMLPNFKQGNYFAGLRTGLNTLLLAANPASDPRRNAPVGTAPASGGNDNFPALGGTDASAANNSTNYETPATTTTPEPMSSTPTAEPESSGPTMLTMLLGVLAVGGIGFLLLKMLRRNSAGSAPGGPVGSSGPDFYGNQPNRNNAGNYNNGPMNQGSSGPGIGGILATGAAAAAGAYLGNRMASGHDTDSAASNYDSSGAGLGAGLGAGAAGGNYSTPTPDSGPDYFSDTDTNSSADYFSSGDNSSYDDSSSGDTGGGGFDSTDDNSGSW